MSAKLQVRYDALVAQFVAPLLTGGTVALGQAIAPGAMSYFAHARAGDPDAEQDIYDALHRGASAIAPVAQVPWPERDLVLLAASAHNLVLVTDPTLDGVFTRSARRDIVRWVDEMVDAVNPPATRAEALARHALLEPVVRLRRRDVVVKNWAYTYRFFGRPVPSNVTALPALRMVKEYESFSAIDSLWETLDRQATELDPLGRLRRLLTRSPVTALVRPDLVPELRFGFAMLAVLSDDAIRGGVARQLVALGEWRMAKVLGKALGDPVLQQKATPAMLYYALALPFEVQMTATLDVPGPGLPEELDLSDPDVARFAAVVPAFFDDDTMIEEVRAFAGPHRAEVQERCARLSRLLAEPIVREVAELVRRCERPGRAVEPRSASSSAA
jgi:hypothetical protein